MTKCLGALALLLSTTALPAAGRTPGEVPRVYALTGARVVVAPGEVLESATVVVRDGVIEAVGARVEPPDDARVRDLEGLTVYAGLVDPYTVRPWPREAVEAEKRIQGLHDNALVRPERRGAWLAGDDAAAERLRQAGFTIAAVAPQEGLFRGSSAVIALGDAAAGIHVLRDPFAQNVTFRSNGWNGSYPGSLMGAVALFHQTLLDADWSTRAQAAWKARPAQTRPPINSAWETLGPVAAGNQAVVIESGDLAGSLRVARLARELGLRVVLVGNGHEYQRLEEVRAGGLPHLLPVAFPEPPKVTGEHGDLELELEELRHWDAAPGNPAALVGTGLPVAFTTFGLEDPKSIHGNLARAIERGLAPDSALAALTTVPAQLLGIAHLVGRVERGKLAYLTVTEGDLFTAATRIREVWVDGIPYKVKEVRPAEVEPAGTWELDVKTPDGERLPAVLQLAGTASSLSGTIAAMDASVDLASVAVSGRDLELAFDGARFGLPGTITMTLSVRGDRLEGSGTAPLGPFTVTGTRTGKAPEVAR